MTTVVERGRDGAPAGGAGARAAGSPPSRRAARRQRLTWARLTRTVNLPAGSGALVWFVVVAVPLYCVIAASFQLRADYLDEGPLSLPNRISLENFAYVLRSGFVTYLVNTSIVTAACVALMLVLAVPAAYAIVRSPHWLVSGVFRVFLLGLAIPAQATIIPVYLIITRLHLYDSLLAIILPTTAFALPLAILVLAGTLRDVPRELYEAMSLEGAGPARLLRSLVLPLGKAGITAVSIFTALSAWNGFLFPLVLTDSPARRVMTLGLWNYQGEFGVNVPGLTAAVLLSAMPVFGLYLFARRGLIAGFAGVGGR
jgi:xylobiose transport system permease protein